MSGLTQHDPLSEKELEDARFMAYLNPDAPTFQKYASLGATRRLLATIAERQQQIDQLSADLARERERVEELEDLLNLWIGDFKEVEVERKIERKRAKCAEARVRELEVVAANARQLQKPDNHEGWLFAYYLHPRDWDRLVDSLAALDRNSRPEEQPAEGQEEG